jgi:hypothetical protein
VSFKVRQPAGGVVRVTPPGDFEYVLKQVSPQMTAHGGFKWPESGPVSCDDWDPTPRCGGGLHGWLRGEGNGGLADNSPECRWLILRVEKKDIVDLQGKVKFPRAEVIACGPRHEIVAEMRSLCPDASVIYSTVAKSNQQAAAAGDGGQASAGDGGQASAGYGGQASAGYGGQASAGARGQASAGARGQASAGARGQASAGYGGQASAGAKGTLIIRWWDYAADRYRVAVGDIGETLDAAGNILEPDVKYRLDAQHRFEKVPT